MGATFFDANRLSESVTIVARDTTLTLVGFFYGRLILFFRSIVREAEGKRFHGTRFEHRDKSVSFPEGHTDYIPTADLLTPLLKLRVTGLSDTGRMEAVGGA
jgi:hypothetical protein